MTNCNYFLDRETLELVEQGDSDSDALARRIVILLSTPGLSRELRNALIVCIDGRRVEASETRASLSRALFDVARQLVEADQEAERDVVRLAMSQAVTLAERPEEVPQLSGLAEFFLPRKPAWVRPVALKAISSSAFAGPLPQVPELYDLRRAVAAMADDLCRADRLGTWGVPTLAIDTVVAAKALGLAGIEMWVTAFGARPLLLEQLETALADLTEWWPVERR